MKISFSLLFLCVFQLIAVNSDAQNATITLSSTNLTVGEMIDEIELQTPYLVVYSNSEVDTEQMVQVRSQSVRVSDCLAEALKNNELSYEFENNYIILSKRPLPLHPEQPEQAGFTLTGKVTDNIGEPIIGANIVEKGTGNGTVTDMDGNYTLRTALGVVIQVSYIGYLTQEFTVDNNTVRYIILQEDSQTLDEIVVVGYGTQRRGEIASAITSVKAENFIKTPAPDAAQMIRGQVAGLAVITADANPTSSSQIILRGITTLKANASPLILIDGIPGELNTVSPEDIDQIDVLKDGSAAAIYGTRGTNGVILISTKNAKGDIPTTIDVNAYLSTQKISRRLDFMSPGQYRQLVAAGKPGAQDNGASIDWLDEVLRTPLTQIYNVSLRGGTKTTNYTASFEYRGLEGIIKRSNNQMIYPRMEVTHRMFENKLRINASLSGYKQSYFSGSDGGSYRNDVYRNALTYNPTDPIRDENDNWMETPSKTDYFNPLALLWEVEGENQATNLRMFASATFTPVTGLDIKYLASSNTYNQTRGYYETKQHTSTVRDGRNGYASRGTTRWTEDLSELTVQYNRTVRDDHTFTVLGGYSWLKYNYQNYYMQNFDFPSDDYTYNSMAEGQALKDGRATEVSEQKESKLIGYFGRFNYNYRGKYMLAASIRYEGSSKFGENHKWGTFPSVSGAWNIKGEDFLADADLLSSLKVRAGYGVTGTVPDEPYMSLNTLSFSSYVYYNGNWIKSTRPASNANPDLRWEKKKETNIGLDFGFMNERITGNIDYYIRNTTDLLWEYDVPSPPYLYSTMNANAGSIKNTGLEITASVAAIQTNDFQWFTSANYSTNKNKLISLSNDKFISAGYSDQGGTGEPIQQSTHRIQEGQPIGNFYGFKSIDIDDDGHWIIEGADGKPKPISEQQPEDKMVLGNGLPKHYLNWNNSFAYKNFDLGITMRGAFGFQILNMPRLQYEAPVMLSRGNILATAYHDVYGKRPLADDQELQYVSYYIENGDYWKIDNVTLGYTFNFNNNWIQRLRIYGSVANLAVITGYSGIDPEVSSTGLSPGNDDKNRYPYARTFTLGVSFKF